MKKTWSKKSRDTVPFLKLFSYTYLLTFLQSCPEHFTYSFHFSTEFGISQEAAQSRLQEVCVRVLPTAVRTFQHPSHSQAGPHRWANSPLPLSVLESRLHRLPHLHTLRWKQCCGSRSAWIRIKVKGRIRIRIRVIAGSGSGSASMCRWKAKMYGWNMSLFEHFFKVLSLCFGNWDPDPHHFVMRTRIRIKVTSRIWIRIKVMRIRNTEWKHAQPVCHLVRITMGGGRLAGSRK